MSPYISLKKTQLGLMFTWVIVAILAVRYVAIGAGPASNTRTLASVHNEHASAQRFHRPRFFGRDRFGGVEVTLEQSQSVPSMEPEKPDKKRTYVQPHWVDGGYGVEILEPGHWIDAETRR